MAANFGHDYGTARPATEGDLRRSKIIGSTQGGLFGYIGRHPARFPSDGGIGIFGGARSGKSASVFAGNELTNYFGCNSITFDPRGELTAISTLAASLDGFAQYSYNPFGIAGLPNHHTNPLDKLTRRSPTLIADTRKTMMDLLPSSGGKHWWEDDGHEWLVNICLAVIERDGGVSFPSLYRATTCISGNHNEWCALSEVMQRSTHPEVRRVAEIIMQAQEDGREGFRAPMNAIGNALAFMQEPHIAASLEQPDFSLSVVCDAQKAKAKIIMPMQHIELCKGLLRVILGYPIRDKMQRGGASRVAVMIDECGQLGHFASVRELYTFGGGVGLIGLCAWQEYSQLTQAFGRDGAAEIFGSMPLRVFAGVRTEETARIVSQLVGVSTLQYIDPHRQADSQHAIREAKRSLLNGGDFKEAANQIRHHKTLMNQTSQQHRQLMTPDEVLNYKGMLAFASGLADGVIQGDWTRYFERGDLAGRYLCNPYHDSQFVTVKSRFGFSKKARMLEADCPPALSHLPQYRDAPFQYIEGYRPRV